MSQTSSENFDDSASFRDQDEASPPTFQPQRFPRQPATKNRQNRSFSYETKNPHLLGQIKPKSNSWLGINQANMPFDLQNSPANISPINIGNLEGSANAKKRSPSQTASDKPAQRRKSEQSKSKSPGRKRERAQKPKRVFRLNPANKYERLVKKVKTDRSEAFFTQANKKENPIDQVYQLEYGDEGNPSNLMNEEVTTLNLIDQKTKNWFVISFHISKISLRLIQLISGKSREEIKIQGEEQIRISLRQAVIEQIKRYRHNCQQQMDILQKDEENIKTAQNHMLNMFQSKGIWIEDWLTEGSEITILQHKKFKELNPKTQQIQLYPSGQQPFNSITLHRVVFCPTYLTSGTFFSSVIALQSSILKINQNTASSSDALLYKILSDNLYALRNEANLAENAHFVSSEIISWVKSVKLPPKIVLLDLHSSNLSLAKSRILNQCYEITEKRFINEKIVQQNQEVSKDFNDSLHQKLDSKGIDAVVYIRRLDKAFRHYSFAFNLGFEIQKKVSTSTTRHEENLSLVRTVAYQFKHILYESSHLEIQQLENNELLNASSLQIPTAQIGMYSHSNTQDQYLDGIQLLTDLMYAKYFDLQSCESQRQSELNFKLQKIKQKFLSLPFQNGYFLSHQSLRRYFNSNPHFKSCIMMLEDVRNSTTKFYKEKLPIYGFSQDIFLLGSSLEKYLAIHNEQTGIVFKQDKFSEEFVKQCVQAQLISDCGNNNLVLKIHPKLLIQAIKPQADQVVMQRVRSTFPITNLIDDPSVVGSLFEKIFIQILLLGSTDLVLPQITSTAFKNISSVVFPFVTLPINRSMSSYLDFNFLSSFLDSWTKSKNLLKSQPCIFLPVQQESYDKIYLSKDDIFSNNRHLSSKNSKSIDFAITKYSQRQKTLQIWLIQNTIQDASKVKNKIIRFIYNFIELIQSNKENELIMKHWNNQQVLSIKFNYMVITTNQNNSNQRKIQLNSQKIMKRVYQIISQKKSGQIDAQRSDLKKLNFATDITGLWMKACQGMNSKSKVTLSFVGVSFVQDLDITNDQHFLQGKFYKKLLQNLLQYKQKVSLDELFLQNQQLDPNTDFKKLNEDISASKSQLKTQYQPNPYHQSNSYNQSKTLQKSLQNMPKCREKPLLQTQSRSYSQQKPNRKLQNKPMQKMNEEEIQKFSELYEYYDSAQKLSDNTSNYDSDE